MGLRWTESFSRVPHCWRDKGGRKRRHVAFRSSLNRRCRLPRVSRNREPSSKNNRKSDRLTISRSPQPGSRGPPPVAVSLNSRCHGRSRKETISQCSPKRFPRIFEDNRRYIFPLPLFTSLQLCLRLQIDFEHGERRVWGRRECRNAVSPAIIHRFLGVIRCMISR